MAHVHLLFISKLSGNILESSTKDWTLLISWKFFQEKRKVGKLGRYLKYTPLIQVLRRRGQEELWATVSYRQGTGLPSETHFKKKKKNVGDLSAHWSVHSWFYNQGKICLEKKRNINPNNYWKWYIIAKQNITYEYPHLRKGNTVIKLPTTW